MRDGGGTEGEKLARLLNPKNWFVKDYTKSGDFNTAFRDAKKAGEEEFIWNNKRYSTKSNLSEEAQMKSYGITDEQRKLTPSGSDRFLYEPIKKASENISKINTGWGYDIPIKNLALASLGKNSLLPLTQGQGLDWKKNKVYFEEGLPTSMFADYSDSPDSPGAKEQDALRLYLGLPQRYQSFKPSKYKKGAFEIVGYNKKLSKIMPSDEYIKTFGHWSFPGGPNEEFAIKPYADLVMGKHTVKKGKDEKGEYIEYYDKFDFDTYGLVGDIADRLNKPFEIYGRKYYKDYGDGVKREMFYSDKELMSLDPKKKNFDTLALQEELYKRGYNLEGSITKDGDLDGILGEETINALLDWQSKNKGKVPKKEDGGTMKKTNIQTFQNSGSPKIKTFKNDPEYFNNRTFENWQVKLLSSGNFGIDPNTDAIIKLKSPVKVPQEWLDVTGGKYEGSETQRRWRAEAGLRDMYNNPVTYLPGMIGLGAVAGRVLGAAAPGAMQLLNAPMQIGSKVFPAVTPANLMTAAGMASAPKNVASGVSNIRQGNYLQGAADLGTAALDVAVPEALNVAKPLSKLLSKKSKKLLSSSKSSEQIEKEMEDYFDEIFRHSSLPELNNPQASGVLEDFRARLMTPEGQRRLKQLGITETDILDNLKIVADENTLGNYWRGKISLNPDLPEFRYVARHEVEHGVQDAYKESNLKEARKFRFLDLLLGPSSRSERVSKASSLTDIDKSLEGLELRKTPEDVDWKEIKSKEKGNKRVSDFYRYLADKQRATNYFASGSGGQEKSAFLAEVQQYMMDMGILPKRSYKEVTPEMVKETFVDAMFDEEMGGKSLRLFNIMKATDKNYKLIADNLNKMLAIIPAAATGVGAMQQDDIILDRQQGGVVNRLQQKMGYKDNSPYKNLPYQNIYSDRITMSGVSRPLVATTDTGVRTVMQPGGEYYFPGATQVRETPLYSNGGGIKDRENFQTMKLNTYTTPLSKLTGISTPKFQNSGKTSSNNQVDENDAWIRQIMEFEATKGSSTGGGLDNWGYNSPKGYRYDSNTNLYVRKGAKPDSNGKYKKSDLYKEIDKKGNVTYGEYTPPKTIKEAVERFKKEYLPDFIDYPLEVRKRLADYAYNSGRSVEDLLLFAAGKISLDDINSSKVFTEDWDKHKDEIKKSLNDPAFIKKLDNARRDVAKTTKGYTLENPNPSYDASWSYRIDMWTPQDSTTNQNQSNQQNKTTPQTNTNTAPVNQQNQNNQNNQVNQSNQNPPTDQRDQSKSSRAKVTITTGASTTPLVSAQGLEPGTYVIVKDQVSGKEIKAKVAGRFLSGIYDPVIGGAINKPIADALGIATGTADLEFIPIVNNTESSSAAADNANTAPVNTNAGGANPPVVNQTVTAPAGTDTTGAAGKDEGDYINLKAKDKNWNYRYNTKTNQWEVKRNQSDTWIKIDDTTEARKRAKPAIEREYRAELDAELAKRKKIEDDKKAEADKQNQGAEAENTKVEGPTKDVTNAGTNAGGGAGGAGTTTIKPTTTTTAQAQNYPPINTFWEGKIRSSMQRKIDKFLEERATAERSKANIQEIQRKKQELEQLGLPPEFAGTDNTIVAPKQTLQNPAEQPPVRDYYGPPYVNGGQIPQYSTGGKALSGAVSGASAGSIFGPIGTGVGAIVGGLAGFLTGRSQEKAAREQRNAELAAQSSNTRQSGLLGLMNLLGSNNAFTNLLTGPDLQNMPQRSPSPYTTQPGAITPRMAELMPPPFQEGAQVEAPIYTNETAPQVYSTGLNKQDLQTPGVKPTLLDMQLLKKEKDTQSSQSAAGVQAGTGQKIVTIKDEDGTPKRVLVDSAGNIIRFIDQPMSEQEKLDMSYSQGIDYAISARNYVEEERKRRAAAALAQRQGQNPPQQQQGGPIITGLLSRNMDRNNLIKSNISMNKSKLQDVINLSNKVNPYRLSPMGVYKNGGLIMEGGVSASRAGFSRQPITGASSTGPLGPKRSEVPSYTNKGVNSIMDLPTNEYVPTENMIPIQAEIGEMIVLPTGDLMPVMARRRHYQMQEDEVTDMTPENSYILSAHGQVRINKDEADLLITETGVKPYRLGQSQNPPTEKTLASVMTKRVMRPAEVAKRINSLFPVLSTDNPFEIAANIENKINRKPYLEGLIQLSELDKYRKGLSEPAMSDLQQQQMQMPQQMPGSPMLARQGRRISRPGVVKAQNSRYIGSGGLAYGYLPDEMGNVLDFAGSLADPYSTAYDPYTGQVVTTRTNPAIYANLNPNFTSPASQQFAQGQNQNGIFSALSAPANFAARLIGSQAIRGAEKAGIARERGIYEQGFGRMGNLMTAGTAAEAAMLGAQDPFVKWRDIPDTYIRSARTQTPGQVLEAQSAAAFANLPQYGEMGQAGLAAQNAAYARGLEQSSKAMMDAAERDRAAFNVQQQLLQQNLAGNVAGRLAAERATTAAINKMLSGYGSLANRYAQGQIDLTGQRMGANIGLSRAEQASKTGLYQNRLNAFTTFTGDMMGGGEEALKALLGFGG